VTDKPSSSRLSEKESRQLDHQWISRSQEIPTDSANSSHRLLMVACDRGIPRRSEPQAGVQKQRSYDFQPLRVAQKVRFRSRLKWYTETIYLFKRLNAVRHCSRRLPRQSRKSASLTCGELRKNSALEGGRMHGVCKPRVG